MLVCLSDVSSMILEKFDAVYHHIDLHYSTIVMIMQYLFIILLHKLRKMLLYGILYPSANTRTFL
jgi:hypothetical protein